MIAKGEEFSDSVLGLHDALVALPRHYIGVITRPTAYFKELANRRPHISKVCGTLLFVNVAFVCAVGLFTAGGGEKQNKPTLSPVARFSDSGEAISVATENSPSHDSLSYSYLLDMSRYVAGMAIFILLLGVNGRKVSAEKRFASISLASCCFPLWALCEAAIGSRLREPSMNLLLVLMSPQPTRTEFLRRFSEIVQAAAPAVVVQVAFTVWWLWLLAGALAAFSATGGRREAVIRSVVGFASYCAICSIYVFVLLCAGMIKVLIGVSHYQEMKLKLLQQPYDYAGAIKESGLADDCKYIPPRGKFILAIASALGQEKVMLDDSEVEIAAVEFRRGNYRAAQKTLQAVLNKKKDQLKNPRRIFFLSIQSTLDNAERAYRDPLYLETETQMAGLSVGGDDLPLALLP